MRGDDFSQGIRDWGATEAQEYGEVRVRTGRESIAVLPVLLAGVAEGRALHLARDVFLTHNCPSTT